MVENKIELRSVKDLLGMKFFIPSYQRGYRWTEQQVTDLLNDVNEFEPQELSDSKERTWYCLQPLVIKEMDSKRKKDCGLLDSEQWYEVIDGQQRLTTIYIILKTLSEYTAFPTIQYQTRPESGNFLANIKEKNNGDNIDYHFMLSTKNVVNTKKDALKIDFVDKLLNSCKVIWYETQDNAYEVFKRLNSGKISLSNAELVKALLLKDDNFTWMNANASRLKQLEMAGEWDKMEQTLHDNSFWYFINPQPEDARFNCTRIDFLLEMILRCSTRIVDKKQYTFKYDEKEYSFGLLNSIIKPERNFDFPQVDNNKEIRVVLSGKGFYEIEARIRRNNNDLQLEFDFDKLLNINDYFIFSTYSKLIVKEGWEKQWHNIQRFFRIMKSWYDNRQLYHYVGYLMNLKGENKMTMLRDLLCDAYMPKDEFLSSLIKRCQQSIGIGVKQKDGKEITQKNFADWEYNKNNNEIHNVLLLFNLATTQNQISEVSRYPFDKHFEAAKKKWSLEHIHAQNERPKIEWTDDEINQLKQYAKSIQFVVKEPDTIEKIATDFVDSITKEKIIENENGQYFLYKVIVGAMMGIKVKRDNNTFVLENNFEKDDHLTNLALLQGDKNAAFNNKLYPEKRAKLAEYENVEKESLFVPICTRNVFFKHYSPNSTNPLLWDKQAGIEYVTAMTKVVAAYLRLDAILLKENNELKYYGVKEKES